MAEQVWEYQVTTHMWEEHRGAAKNQETVGIAMGEMGAEGWELVSTTSEHSAKSRDATNGAFWLLLFWKRPR